MSDISTRIETYYATVFDGTGKSLADVKPFIEDYVDPNVVIRNENGDWNYEQMLENIEGLLEAQIRIEVHNVKTGKVCGRYNRIRYLLKVFLDSEDEPIEVMDVATFRDEKVICIYSRVTDKSLQDMHGTNLDMAAENLGSAFDDYLTAFYDFHQINHVESTNLDKIENGLMLVFDGRKDKTVEHVLPLIESICDPDEAVVATPQGEIRYHQLVNHVDILLRERTTVEVLRMEKHPKGLECSLKFNRPGKVPLVTTSVSILRNGRVIRTELQDTVLLGEPESDDPKYATTPQKVGIEPL